MDWRRFARWFLAPSALIGVAVGVILWGGFNTALEATNTMEFCVSCHEMRDYVYKEYKETPHYKNASGVRAGCPDCHVPRDWTHKVVRKVQATNELWAKLVGRIDTPEKFEARRLDLARHEWERMRDNDSRECRNCHSYEAMDFHKQHKGAAQSMQQAAKAGQTCIDCHKGVAHQMPDQTARFRAQFVTLESQARNGAKTKGDFITFRAAPFYFTKPSEADVEGQGLVAALTPVFVTGFDGPWAIVTIKGWQREGSSDKLLAALGQRINAVTFHDEPRDQVSIIRKAKDDKTDEEWAEARVAGFVPRDALTHNVSAVMDYGDEMYQSACQTCHKLYAPGDFTPNQWIGKTNSMKRFVPLESEEFQFLQKYLQSLAVKNKEKASDH